MNDLYLWVVAVFALFGIIAGIGIAIWFKLSADFVKLCLTVFVTLLIFAFIGGLINVMFLGWTPWVRSATEALPATVEVTRIVPGPTQLVEVPGPVQTVVVRETVVQADTPIPLPPTSTPIPSLTATLPVTTNAPANTPVPAGATPQFGVFTPDWTNLSTTCQSRAEFLAVHGLSESQIIWHPASSVSWESCQFVIELKPEFYGRVTIPLVNGYAYTLAPVGTDVTDMWGGDPTVTTSTLQWGFTSRWGPTYQSLVYKWLDPNNPCEWLVRDWRFGRYWRLPNLGLTPPEVPYYGRLGPYKTLPGNVNCSGWMAPEVDQTVPRDYLQASAMLGGLANSSEWIPSLDGLNWAWRYSAKVAGSANYCPSGMPCWQTTYLPPNSRGYIELWDNGQKKFYAVDLPTLMLGNKNVDEFTYHSDPNK